jgi:hypothetical protein
MYACLFDSTTIHDQKGETKVGLVDCLIKTDAVSLLFDKFLFVRFDEILSLICRIYLPPVKRECKNSLLSPKCPGMSIRQEERQLG